MNNNKKAEMLRIVNRHKAKTLAELEEINCPKAYLSAVRSSMDWLRHDLVEMAAKISRR